MTTPEAGMKILKETGCQVGNHVWTWAHTEASKEPPPFLMCSCGLLPYPNPPKTP